MFRIERVQGELFFSTNTLRSIKVKVFLYFIVIFFLGLCTSRMTCRSLVCASG